MDKIKVDIITETSNTTCRGVIQYYNKIHTKIQSNCVWRPDQMGSLFAYSAFEVSKID